RSSALADVTKNDDRDGPARDRGARDGPFMQEERAVRAAGVDAIRLAEEEKRARQTLQMLDGGALTGDTLGGTEPVDVATQGIRRSASEDTLGGGIEKNDPAVVIESEDAVRERREELFRCLRRSWIVVRSRIH